jgi:nitrate/nitrite transporter NarK
MFSPKVVGTANAIVGGWGNLGGGFAFLLMPGLFQLTKACGADEFLAWKIAVVIPSIVCVITGMLLVVINIHLYRILNKYTFTFQHKSISVGV